MSDSRIIIFGLLTVCVVVLFRPVQETGTAKEVLLFVLGALAGYMRREPQFQTPPEEKTE
jgi:hypothetical protein